MGDVGSARYEPGVGYTGTTSPMLDHKDFKLQYLRSILIDFSEIWHFKG